MFLIMAKILEFNQKTINVFSIWQVPLTCILRIISCGTLKSIRSPPISKIYFGISTLLEFLFNNWKRNCSTSFQYNSREHVLSRQTLGVRHRNSIHPNDLQIQMFRRRLYNTLFLFYYVYCPILDLPSHWDLISICLQYLLLKFCFQWFYSVHGMNYGCSKCYRRTVICFVNKIIV